MSEQSLLKIVPKIQQSVINGMIDEDYDAFLKQFKQNEVSCYVLHLIIVSCLNVKDDKAISQNLSFYKHDDDIVLEEMSRLKTIIEKYQFAIKKQCREFVIVVVLLMFALVVCITLLVVAVR